MVVDKMEKCMQSVEVPNLAMHAEKTIDIGKRDSLLTLSPSTDPITAQLHNPPFLEDADMVTMWI